MTTQNSFGASGELRVGSRSYQIFRLSALEKAGVAKLARIPYSIKILLENLLRNEDGSTVKRSDIEYVAKWDTKAAAQEINFRPARVVLQDFTGVPCVVDLAAMRDALAKMGSDPKKANPLIPVDLVIDHSVQVDEFGTKGAFEANALIEYSRNQERYAFLRWGQSAFQNFRVVPPDTGIVHQVNLEYLAPVVFNNNGNAYPDTVVGTDSHTTMINGLGVVGWGVGGIEAEACMLGQPATMLLPQVVGFKLSGKLPEGATATDLVLTVTQMLRKKGVVGKFVEFYGDGLNALSLADRATISNMAPEYGATIGVFPIDEASLEYLRLTNRSPEQIALVEAYAKEQGLFRIAGAPDPVFTDTLSLDLAAVVPSLAGPKRPQDRIPLSNVKAGFTEAMDKEFKKATELGRRFKVTGEKFDLGHGDVVIAAITSCTNTSNPSVMIGAGLLARNAIKKGLKVQPWVKTSLAPGSQVVGDYLAKSGLQKDLDKLGFNLVGYGCTTCIGNSGPLPPEISKAINDHDLVAAAVLSGNRNFEGRVNQDVRANYLASPPLVVAYAIAGNMNFDFARTPLGVDKTGKKIFLKDIWPTSREIASVIKKTITKQVFARKYASVFKGDTAWSKIAVKGGLTYEWDRRSTYVQNPPYFDHMSRTPRQISDIVDARILGLFLDSITTDHISPAGSIKVTSPAGRYLVDHKVKPADFNQYGTRRGNHEVMMRGTFANIRIKNQMCPGVEGGVTIHYPSGEQMPIYDAAMRYK